MENRNNNQNNVDLQNFNNQQNFNDQGNYQNYENYNNVEGSQFNNYQSEDIRKIPESKNNYGKLFLTVFAAFALGATSVFGAQAVMGTGKALNSTVTVTKEDKDNQQNTVPGA